MIPKELYNRRRRHDNTPQSLVLIITNYIVCTILFTTVSSTGWFFSIVLACLILYNVHIIRRNRDEITRINIIAYAVGWAGIVLLYFFIHKI